jgi:sialate O-acetylesterase
LGPRPPQPDIVGWREAAAAADYPEIRQYKVPEHAAPAPTDDAGGAWTVCSPRTAPEFSAVGFFFARAVNRAEKVPVGLLFTAWGGTMAQAWTSAPALETMADFSTARGAAKAMIGNPDFDKTLPAVLYNGMIAPLQPFPIRGVIWYQGESDCDHARQYRELFPALIADWRRGWGLGDFPFLYVQIAPSKFWTPEIREAQLLTLGRSRNTAMVGTADVGDPQDMHPARKAPVGERLALAARALAYGEAVEYSGPLFASLKIEGHRAVVRFAHVSGGLNARNGAARGFEVAGSDGKFVPAQADLQGGTAVVSADRVGSPVAVRYGWARAPDVNVFNRDGLPASPFRTDVGPK